MILFRFSLIIVHEQDSDIDSSSLINKQDQLQTNMTNSNLEKNDLSNSEKTNSKSLSTSTISPREEEFRNIFLDIITSNSIRKIDLKELKIDTHDKSTLIYIGGQAEVYHGEFEGKHVAVRLLIDIDFKCLAHEIIILSKLDHENIPKFYGIALEKNSIYLVFDYIDGKTLASIDISLYSERELINIIKSLCNIIEYVFKQNLIHRDIKNENILIDSKIN